MSRLLWATVFAIHPVVSNFFAARPACTTGEPSVVRSCSQNIHVSHPSDSVKKFGIDQPSNQSIYDQQTFAKMLVMLHRVDCVGF